MQTTKDPVRTEGSSAGRGLVALQVMKFALAGIIALTIVGVATSIASRRLGEREAIAEARTTTVIKAQGVVEPSITDALLSGDATARASVDRVVRRDVLDASLIRVKLWTRDGTIVYSDEARLIGADYALGADEEEAFVTGKIEAEVSDLSKPENRFERDYGKLLEVYLPIRTPTGDLLLFEAYYRYSNVATSGSRLWRSFAPVTLGGLLMLQLVQIPLAWSLARRLGARMRERETLLERALHASEVERRQIASDLHDGAVQDLAGVAYALAAAERRSEPMRPEDAALLRESAEAIRMSIKGLRSLIVDIYPPDFAEVSFDSALTDLLARAQERGLTASLDTSGVVDPFPDPVARLLYRATQEGIRNVLSHADAASVRVRVGSAPGRAFIEVTDDGRGLAPDAVAGPASGHLGLAALRGLLMDAGGSLNVRSAEGGGTTLRAEVPV